MAEENNGTGLEGLLQAAQQDTEAQADLKAAKSEYDADQASYDRAEQTEDASEDKVASTLASIGTQVKSAKETAQSLKQKAAEADPERVAAAATEQGAVSIADALDAINNHKKLKSMAKQASGKYFQYAAQELGTTMSTTMTMAVGSVNELVTGKQDVTGLTGALTVGAGALAALATTGKLQDFSSQAGFSLLSDEPLPEGVEEKHLDGLETEDAWSGYMENYSTGEGTDPYAEANAGAEAYTGPDKTPAKSTAETVHEASQEATELSDSDLAFLSDASNLSPDALDDLFSAYEKAAGDAGPAQEAGLADSVAEDAGAPSKPGQAPGPDASRYSPKMQELLAGLRDDGPAADAGPEMQI